MQFTASAALEDKLRRLQALMRRSVPDGDLGAIIEAAVTEKLERLEAKRFGRTRSPRKGLAEADTAPRSRDIPAPVRRAVYERDAGRCTYVSPDGRRCSERDDLEFHHEEPYGRLGDHSVSNIKLACHAHNALWAERDYGLEVMRRYRRGGGTVSEPAAAYSASFRERLGGPRPLSRRVQSRGGPEYASLREHLENPATASSATSLHFSIVDGYTSKQSSYLGDKVLDAVRAWPAPLDPSAVVREVADVLRSYRVVKVAGDRYGGEWPREAFRARARAHGITYEPAGKDRSGL